MEEQSGCAENKSAATISAPTAAEIAQCNEDLTESSITLVLSPHYDKRLLPIKAQHLRGWWEDDSKTKMHARFCLPLTMAGGLGYYILAPATFVVSWDGDESAPATIEVKDASSHAHIDNESCAGSFTIYSAFVPRTKNVGDYLLIKSVANQRDKPYSILESMIEAWWSPDQFAMIGLLNRPGQFTIRKGEPIAQMIVLSQPQMAYELGWRDGYPPIYPDWQKRQGMPEKNLDYFKGRLPNQTPVCPHFRNWSDAKISNEAHVLSVDDCWTAANEALSNENMDEALRQFNLAIEFAEERNEVSEALLEDVHKFALLLDRHHPNEPGAKLLLKCSKLNEQFLDSSMPSTGEMLHDIGDTYKRIEELYTAAKYFEKALRVKRERAATPLSLAATLTELGAVYGYRENFEESEQLLSEAEALYEQHLPAGHWQTTYLKNMVANMQSHRKNFALAELLYDEVLQLKRQAGGDASPELIFTYVDMAFHYKLKGDIASAEECFDKALELQLGTEGEESELKAAQLHEQKFWLFRDNNLLDRAKSEMKTALAIRAKYLHPANTSVRQTNQLLSDICQSMGQFAEADEYDKRAKSP